MNKNQLKKYLIKCCYWYYVKAEPLISDRTYDYKIYELQKLENYGADADKDSPTQMIWGDSESQYPEWAKEKTNG